MTHGTKEHAARLCRVPKTQLAFVNVSIVPARTRSGAVRFMSAAWGGAIHLFDPRGRTAKVPLPEGALGTYAFTPDVTPGLAWATVTSETKVTLVQFDVDDARLVSIEDLPLRGMTWSAVMTRSGRLVTSAHPGDVLVYDRRLRKVTKVFAPLSPMNRYGKYLQVAPDDSVIIPMMVPGAELIRLDTQTGAISAAPADSFRGPNNYLPASSTLLPSGHYAIAQEGGVALLDYPGFKRISVLAYPADGRWQTFRNEEDGRLFAHRADGGPLYVLDASDQWAVYLERFPLQCGRARLDNMFATLPGNRLLGLSAFGEVVEYNPEGTPRLAAELDNYGYQSICALAPGDGSRVFTTTFINSSFQELDLATGDGRNVRPCQKLAGQASAAVWHQGRLWLACYHGAEITVFDPNAEGEWPENPRPFAEIGHEQLRPVALCAEGDHLWCDTHAQYAKYGGALARINIRSGECRVWRHLVPDHNPTGIVLDSARRRIYGGTTVWPDMQSAPAAKGPAAVYAFDMEREAVAWTAQPVEGAERMSVQTVWRDTVIARADGRLILLRAEDGVVDRIVERELPPGEPAARLFVGGDGELYLASPQGLFRYDLDRGPGDRVIEGPVSLPCVRGPDLLFIRAYDVGLAEGLWRS